MDTGGDEEDDDVDAGVVVGKMDMKFFRGAFFGEKKEDVLRFASKCHRLLLHSLLIILSSHCLSRASAANIRLVLSFRFCFFIYFLFSFQFLASKNIEA